MKEDQLSKPWRPTYLYYDNETNALKCTFSSNDAILLGHVFILKSTYLDVLEIIHLVGLKLLVHNKPLIANEATEEIKYITESLSELPEIKINKESKTELLNTLFQVINYERLRKTILILSVHPDDSCLSFSGLIQKHVNRGDRVIEIEFAVGGPSSNVTSEVRKSEWISAMKFNNILHYEIAYHEMDGRLDQIPSCQITGDIDKYINKYKPDEVYCTSDSEHSDHRALYKAFLGAARLKSGFMPKLFAVGTYLFSDQLYRNFDGGKIYQPLTDEMFEHKLKEFQLYKSQAKPAPNPLGENGIRIMSEYHGMMCGHKYAELYYQLRYVRD